LPPKFSEPFYAITIEETAAVGDRIPLIISIKPELAQIEVVDPDDLFSYVSDGGNQFIQILVEPDAIKHGDDNYIRKSVIKATIDDGIGGTLSTETSLIVYYPIPIGNL